jgi:glyoxylase-like metal-dependent hydrolase (beta-lactamase superfamily II)
MKTSEVEVYALYLGQRSVPTSLVMYHTDPEVEITINYFLWCVKQKENVIVIDTGFTPEIGEERGLINIRHPIDQLAKLDISPEKVNTVICTHLHWDHAGGCEFFNKSIFFIPEKDLSFFSGSAAKYSLIRHFVYPQDLNRIVKMNYDGRVKFINGDQSILPGISVHWVGGHTPGLHAVSIETGKGTAILGSDICYLYRNLEEDTIPGLYVNLLQTLTGFERLRELASEEKMIFPSHDPKICSRFNTDDSEIIRII